MGWSTGFSNADRLSKPEAKFVVVYLGLTNSKFIQAITVRNELGFPLINSAVFGRHDLETNADIDQVLADYEKFGISTDCNPPGPTYGDIPLFNPPDKSLKEWTDGLAQSMIPHWEELQEFALWCVDAEVKPVVPLYQAGWTRYSLLTGKTKKVPYPTESVFAYDCETFVKGSDFGHAIIGTALSSKALYVWLHPAFVDGSLPYEPMYVPVGTNKLIIGHNVTGFDRGRCEGSAVFGQPVNAWLDTMSMHMVTSGLISAQRFWFMEKAPRFVPTYASHGCLNNLVDTFNFYCGFLPTYKWEDIDVPKEEVEKYISEGWELA